MLEEASRADTAALALRLAVKTAAELGAEFRSINSTIVVTLPEGIAMPPDLREMLEASVLSEYFGIADQEADAVGFFEQFQLKPVVVHDYDSCETAMAALSGQGIIGLDFETAAEGWLPPPIKINKDGRPSKRQPKSGDELTDPQTAHIACAQLYAGGDRVFLFVEEGLKALLTSRWITRGAFAAHNSFFETLFLQHIDAAPATPIECTMTAGGLCFGPPRRLAAVWQNLTDETVPKQFGASVWDTRRLSRGQLAYAASDAVLPWAIATALLPQLRASRAWEAYGLVRDAYPETAAMQRRGIPFDRAVHARWVAARIAERETERRRFRKLAKREPPTTPAETIDFINEIATTYELLAWPRTPKTGVLSTAGGHLKRLEAGHPEVGSLLKIRAVGTLLALYGDKLTDYIRPDGRVYPQYRAGGAISGRYSADHPNCQQWPGKSSGHAKFRECVAAKPGNVIVSADWSMLELRAAAWISKCPDLTAALANGEDLHKVTGAAMAGRRLEDVDWSSPDGEKWRQRAKPVNFGSIFGMGAAGLVEYALVSYDEVMTLAEAERYLAAFFGRFPGHHQWMLDHWGRVQQAGYLEIPGGRVVDGRWPAIGALTYTQACNLPVQGAAANAMLREVRLIGERLPGTLIMAIHDEPVLEVPEGQAEHVAAVLVETMYEAFHATFPGAPDRELVDIGVGQNWYAASELNARKA